MGHLPRAARRWAPLLLLALLASACSAFADDGDGGGSPETTLPAAATLLRVATTDWPACLNPLTCADGPARDLVLQHVVPKLMEVDAAGAHVPSPVLAGPPDVAVDPDTGEQTIVFVLAEEARWHDGRPITSSDVRGTWQARMATPGAATAGHDLITAVDDADPLVARVTLRQPWSDWPELFGGEQGWLLQADAFGADLDLTDRFDEFVPFGAGPYELVSFDEQSLVLVARRDHWDSDRQAGIDQVRIDLFADADADADAVVPGSIDLALPDDELPDVPDRFAVAARPEPAVVGLLFDRRTPALSSPGVRLAVDTALDRSALVELADADPGDLVTCLGALPGDDACGAQLVEDGLSPEVADAILTFDGWLVGPDGRRSRPDLPLATPVSYDPALEGAEDIASAVAVALVSRGFTATAQPVAAAEWFRADRQQALGIGVYAVPLGTAERVLALHGCGEGTANPLGWCDAEPQALARSLATAPDERRRQELAEELGALAAASLAWLPLHQRSSRFLVDPDRIELPDQAPLGSGPLGALHAFVRADR